MEGGGRKAGDADEQSESRSAMDESLEAALEIEKEAVRKMNAGPGDKSNAQGGGGLDAEAFRKKHEISVRVMVKGGKAVDPASEGVQVMDPVQVRQDETSPLCTIIWPKLVDPPAR